jgi:hypothetical protein
MSIKLQIVELHHATRIAKRREKTQKAFLEKKERKDKFISCIE